MGRCNFASRLSRNERGVSSESKPIGLAMVAILIAAFFGLSTACAGTLTFEYSFSFGDEPPVGPSPFFTAVFDDGGSPGSVTLTMMVAATVGDADVTEMYFNLDPSLDPTSLNFSRTGGTGPSAGNTTILTSVDAYKADGDGLFDILFDFPPPPGNQSARFNAGENLIYDITGIPSLTAASFNFFSAPDGGHGPFLTVARFQSTGTSGDGSDWIAGVPEPSTFALAFVGAGALVATWLRRRRK